MVTKRIVCLANSRKLSGRCVAGRELAGNPAGVWIRPVSARPDREVSIYEREYEDGSDPQTLDIIDVPLLEPLPEDYQRENWFLDPEYYWTRVGRLAWNDLVRIAERPSRLWLNGRHTYHGMNDEITLADALTLTNSLVLIQVEGVELRVFRPGEAFGNSKRRIQARFHYRGNEYRLFVTDPVIETTYRAREDGTYTIGESCLTISIGEPFNDNCYKLVAAIIPRQTS